ncbi:MAG TPA: SCE4755 family polysaccharide monooxygenase-like protein [Polyangiaceae bacterium]|nr:SCE4755 family polysaccharide monooxygenase-like protein [Polyangiaceae bacterium]
MIRRPFASIGLLGLALTLSGSAAAHLSLKSINGQMPVARAEAPAEDLKASPCGQNTNGRTATVTALTAGAEITITWEEYIDHPGFYRIAFAEDGDTFPEIANMDDVTPAQCTLATCMNGGMTIPQITPIGDEVLAYVADGETSASVVVPNVNCENCTLQVIQFMTDKLGNNNDDEIYYQCADITITGGAAGGAGGAGGGGAGGGGAGGAAGGGAGGAAGGTGGAAGGGAGGAAGGTGGAAAGAAGTPTAGGGTAGAAGSVAAAGTVGAAGSTVTPPASTPAAADEGGCAISTSQSSSPWSILVLGVAAMLFGLRRQQRN